MSESLEGNEFWLQCNGKKVTIDKIEYRLKVNSYRAIYPHRRKVIDVSAECVDTESEYYLEVKRILKGDWVMDIFENELDRCKVIEELNLGKHL